MAATIPQIPQKGTRIKKRTSFKQDVLILVIYNAFFFRATIKELSIS